MDKPKSGRGGKREGSGRKPRPDDQKKRLEPYVDPAVYDWIIREGGNKFAAKLLTEAHIKSLIV